MDQAKIDQAVKLCGKAKIFAAIKESIEGSDNPIWGVGAIVRAALQTEEIERADVEDLKTLLLNTVNAKIALIKNELSAL